MFEKCKQEIRTQAAAEELAVAESLIRGYRSVVCGADSDLSAEAVSGCSPKETVCFESLPSVKRLMADIKTCRSAMKEVCRQRNPSLFQRLSRMARRFESILENRQKQKKQIPSIINTMRGKCK